MNEITVVTSGAEIAVYRPIMQQLAEIKAANAQIVFDYEDPADNKKARSYIYRLRQLKADADRARKDEKQASLEYGRRVDSAAKEIIGEIEEMIDVHAAPIAEIEQREKDRVADIQSRISAMYNAHESEEPRNSAELAEVLTVVKSVQIDDSFAEFAVTAAKTKDMAVAKLESMVAAAQKQEAEQAELERLRKEAEERAIRDREEQIRKEAKEQAEREAEARREADKKASEDARAREIEAAEKRELELKLTAERAMREKEEAQRRADRAEAEAIEKAAAEKRLAETEELKRRQDKARVESVKAEILVSIKGKTAAQVVDALVAGEIPFTKVTF